VRTAARICSEIPMDCRIAAASLSERQPAKASNSSSATSISVFSNGSE